MKKAAAKKKSPHRSAARKGKLAGGTAKKKTSAARGGRARAKRAAPKARGRSAAGELAGGGLLAEIVKKCADALLVVDRKGIVRLQNPAGERLLGRLVNKPFGYPLHPHRSMEVDVRGRGRETGGVAELLADEMTWDGESLYVVSVRDVTNHVRIREQLRALSDVDPLTGLLNRRGFFDAAHRQLALAQRTGREMVLLFLDLDGLKWINDTQGHLEGDQALIEVASVLKRTFRQPDVLGRYGGDEYAILAIEAKGRSAEGIVQRLERNLNAHNARKRTEKTLSFSVGLAYFDPKKPRSVDLLIEEADESMYKQKRTKRRGRA